MRIHGLTLVVILFHTLSSRARVIPSSVPTLSTRTKTHVHSLTLSSTNHPTHPTPISEISINGSTPMTDSFMAYLSKLYNTTEGNFYEDTTRSSWNDFWKEAIAWEIVMDAYIIKVNGSSLATLANLNAVYDGFMALYSDMNGVCNAPPNATKFPPIQNPCNDDVMWWARASARAFEITGNQRYLLCAHRLFDYVWTKWDNTYGGGIRWGCTDAALRDRKLARPQDTQTPGQKNVATNAPSVITAVKLSRALNNSSYLDKALLIYNWLESHLANSTTGHVSDNIDNNVLYDWRFTYNYGTMIGASVALYTLTQNVTYLAHAQIYAGTSIIELTQPNSTIIQYEGGGDAGGFAGIYIRHLNELRVTSPATSQNITSLIATNAMTAYANRRADGLMGGNWANPAPQGTLETHMVGSAVTAVLLGPFVQTNL